MVEKKTEIEGREDAQRPVERLVMRLRKYNEWRRGADFAQPEPAEIGRDIDIAIELIEENRKLRSMCKAAAAEIEEHWEAHCDEEGYGPANLCARLSGRIKPGLYPGFDDA